jgi:hypothetical protein
MKKALAILSVIALLFCASSCQPAPAEQPTEVPSDAATAPGADSSLPNDDDIQYVDPEGDNGIGDQWESLDEFKAYAADAKDQRDYPMEMNIANENGMVLVPVKRDYAAEEPWVFRVLEMYREAFDRSWIWYYTQGEKGWIIVKVGKLTQEEYELSQTMTCAELLHEISPILVQPGDEVDGFTSIYEQNITIAGNYETTSMIMQRSDGDGKFIDCVYGQYLISIADNGGTVDDEWLRNLDFYAIPYVE